MKQQRIAVIGGSGFIGTYIAEHLAREDVELTLATRWREPGKARLALLPKTELTPVDTTDQAALTALLAGHDAVVSMVGVLHGSRRGFERAHVELVDRIVTACRDNGIRRLVHISALGADPEGPSLYQQSKGHGEQVILASGLDWTILRPSVVFGRGDSFLTMFAKLARLAPVLPLAGAKTRFQPVWVDDVARAVTACLERDATIEQCLELAGPKVYTLAELVGYVARLTGHSRPIVGLPYPLAYLQAALMELAPGKPLMSRDNVRSLTVDNVASAPFPSELLGFEPTALEAVVPGYLAGDEFNATMSRYRGQVGGR